MTLETALRGSFGRSFDLYRDLLDVLGGEVLSSRLAGLPSNTIGAQLWCVVGARESYSRAIQEGGWSGFSCSLSDPLDAVLARQALDRSAEAVTAVLDGLESYDEARARLLLDLLEHEAQHHGQLIRYLYALGIQIPPSWRERYALG